MIRHFDDLGIVIVIIVFYFAIITGTVVIVIVIIVIAKVTDILFTFLSVSTPEGE